MAILVWVIFGWVCGFLATPRWMREQDPVGFFITTFFCGAVVGPFGLLWFVIGNDEATRRFNRERNEELDRKRKSLAPKGNP